MIKKLLLLTFLLAPLISFSQSPCCHDANGIPVDCCAYGCVDSCVPKNFYGQCLSDYVPVCACDGYTYRNECAAETWGGVCPGKFTTGPCGNFDVDLYPTAISPDPKSFGRLSIYMKSPGTATVLIYNAYGRLVFEKLFSTNLTYDKIPTANPYSLTEPQTYQTGVYILVVTVNGENISKKFVVISNK